MAEQGAERMEGLPAPMAQSEAAGPGTWGSDPPGGAKVCALRLDTVHLVHTGLAKGWDPDLVREYFQEASLEFRPPEGTEATAEGGQETPAEVRGWIEALRYGQTEMWPEAEELGSTVCLAREDALWVLTRGVHRVAILCEAGERKAEEVPAPDALALWRLDRGARWRIEVSLPDGLAALWTARWRPTPALVPPVPAPEQGTADPVVPPAAPGPGDALPAPEDPGSAAPSVLRRWRPALPAALRPYRRQLGLTGMVLAGLAALVLAWSAVPKRPVLAVWEQFSDFCAGRYRVRVTTVPPGATLRVDGQGTAVVTPGWLLLREGRHKVEASLGEYGAAALDVTGKRGSRGAQQAALLGRLSLGCADPGVTLSAFLDGQPAGRLPVILDSVAAGVRQVSFQGRDVRPWTEEVGVVAGRTTQVLARPEKLPDHGVVLARAYRVGTEGLKDLPGAAVYVDGKWAASTPARLEVLRGLHTVRLAAGGVDSPVQLLRVEGGQELYATAEFGRSPEPGVVHELLGAPSVAQPPVVRARLRSPMPIRVSEMRLYFRAAGREFQRLSMGLRAGDTEVEADAALPVKGLAPGTMVSYFVTVRSDEGEEFVGEMRSVKLVP